ncbi:hypothetical protein DER46DRAFT_582606 [Fusarium sp. MPI-SDFR-AT-0072]|nr:hypothetical protein DER46DRAFT_582606 [Fusarium sp. MPI-SDFR-AT-0072]
MGKKTLNSRLAILVSCSVSEVEAFPPPVRTSNTYGHPAWSTMPCSLHTTYSGFSSIRLSAHWFRDGSIAAISW